VSTGRRNRRVVMVVSGWQAGGGGAVIRTVSQSRSAGNRPAVLFADDQRADTIAALGNPVIRTPNLGGGRLPWSAAPAVTSVSGLRRSRSLNCQ
jgi:hypothetical protein